MKYQIKNRYIDKIIVEMEAETLKEVVVKNKADLQGADLQEADLQGADLWRADLRRANLWGANLRKADLQGADLQGAEIKITQKEELLKSIGVIIED